MIETYLVGGAVRDRLLGQPHGDRDWVIVGGSPEQLEAAGYQAIVRENDAGSLLNFPVFLHPNTKEEHALARRSLADTDDTSDAWARFRNVTLEEDLSNRDFTMNAIAEDLNGRIIDPFNGECDLRDKVIRHIGSSFSEDPLRVLRGARFAAAYPKFSLATETAALFSRLAAQGALNALDPDRVWQEVYKAMAAPAPRRFIEVLRETRVLAHVFPEIDALFGIPQPAEHHPEIDTGIHTLMVLDQAATITDDPRVRFAALVHDLGKIMTPKDQFPSHIKHEVKGLDVFQSLSSRVRIPGVFDKTARAVIRHHLRCHQLTEAGASAVARLLRDLGAYRDPEIVGLFGQACLADARGRLGFEDRDYPQQALLTAAFEASRGVRGKDFLDAGLAPGPQIGQRVIAEQVRRIRVRLQEMSSDGGSSES